MYFSMQDDRQADSVRESDVEAAAGMQWLKQFLFDERELGRNFSTPCGLGWVWRILGNGREAQTRKGGEGLLIHFLDEEFCVLDVAFGLQGGDDLVFQRRGFGCGNGTGNGGCVAGCGGIGCVGGAEWVGDGGNVHFRLTGWIGLRVLANGEDWEVMKVKRLVVACCWLLRYEDLHYGGLLDRDDGTQMAVANLDL